MRPINSSQYRNIVILTGAGISVASGIPSFRGQGATEGAINPLEASTTSSLQNTPEVIWQVYGSLRNRLATAQANTSHLKLAEFENRLSAEQNFTLITQNIDGLHQRAGSNNVVEIHGNVSHTRCSNDTCSLEPFSDERSYDDELPTCPLCNSPLRPDIVLIGERIPLDEEWLVKRALRDCDLFIAVGTSGTVAPASNFVRSADYSGARTILINLEKMQPKNPYFQEEYLGYAEDLLPVLLA